MQNLRARTRKFSVRIIKLVRELPKSVESEAIKRQLVRCGTSVGAHYYEACRARSPKEFASKLDGALQELDETTYWLQLLSDSEIISVNRLASLLCEANELISMFTTMSRNTKQKI